MSAVRAPGKVMVAGEYVVLEGSDAIVMAVDRYAVARPQRALRADTSLPPEAAAALSCAREEGFLREEHVLEIDVSSLSEGDRKLGLGSSAAGCVAALGAALVREGADLNTLRPTLARLARRGHRRAQGGGSGVDVLASALGGLSLVHLPDGPEGEAVAEPLEWPQSLHWAVLWTGVPVRTSELIRAVRTHAARAPREYATQMAALHEATGALVAALRAGDAPGAVTAIEAHARAMDTLGRASDVPIVTEGMRRLAAVLGPFGAALKPSGAGGGDIALVVATSTNALAASLDEGKRQGFVVLDIRLDRRGVSVQGEEP